MIAREGTWSEVSPNVYVRAKDNTVWRIDGAAGGRILLVGREGRRTSIEMPDRNAPVTILEPTEGEAIESVRSVLGAEPLAIETPAGTKCPRFPLTSKGLHIGKAHVLSYHGVWAEDIKTIAELIECHDEHHETPAEKHIDHYHV